MTSPEPGALLRSEHKRLQKLGRCECSRPVSLAALIETSLFFSTMVKRAFRESWPDKACLP